MAWDRNKKLREEVKKAHKRAGDKVSRTKRFHNIDISGTTNDPRVNAREISKMNARELRSYNASLSGFLSRNVQFAKGARDTIIDYSFWNRKFMPTQNKYNKFVEARRAEVDNLQLIQREVDSPAETIGQRRARVNKVQNGGPAYAVGDILNDPYATVHYKPGFVKGNEAMKKIMENMEYKMSPEYQRKMIEDDRKTIDKALDKMGLSDLKEAFAILSDKQFDILFNESTFAETFFPRYVEMQATMDSLDDDAIQEKRELTEVDIDWVREAVPIQHPLALTKLADLNTMAAAKGINLRQLFTKEENES
jgi:hypothetical protein